MSGGNVLDVTKVILKSLVLSSPEPLTIDQLGRDYRNREGKPIPYVTLGYSKLKDFLLSMPDVLAYDSARQTFTAGKGGKSEHIHKLVAGQKKSNKRGPNRSNNANHRNNNGQQSTRIWDTLPSNFETMNYNQQNHNTNACPPPYQMRSFEPGRLMDPPNYCNNSLMGHYYHAKPVIHPLITNLPRGFATGATSGIPPLIPNLPRGSTTGPLTGVKHSSSKNFDKRRNETVKKKSNSTAVDPNQNDNEDTLNGDQSDLSLNEIGALPPMDDDDPIRYIGTKRNSKYGRKIPKAPMPKTLEPGHSHQICVTEVTRFPHFYFQFADKEDTMEELQDELNSRYESSTKKVLLSEIVIGNACAVWHASKWSRAEILSQPDDNDRVKLLFVDYGTIDSVAIEHIRQLYHEICEYPQLCHRGALAFLKPSRNDQIEKKIIRKFCKMVAAKSLIAVFSNVDKSDDISMTLIDTLDPKVDFIVNKILMNDLQEMDLGSDKELDVLK